MSSPSMKTLGSRSISSKSAWRIASRYVVSAIEGPPARGTFVPVDSRGHTPPVPERLGAGGIRVYATQRVVRLRHGRRLGLVCRRVNLRPDSLVNPGQLRGSDPLGREKGDVAIERIILRLPALDLSIGDIRLIVVLRVSLAPVRDELNERDTLAAARAINGASRDIVRGEHIVAIGLLAGNSIGHRLVAQLRRRGLPAQWRGVRIAIVLDDYHHGTALHRREVDPFVERTSGRRTVTHVDQPHARFAAHLEREC